MIFPSAAQAASLLRAGRDAEAIAAYRALLARQPEDANAWFNLAWLLRRRGDYEEALSSYQSAIDHGLRGAEEAHVNRAAIYSEHLQRTDAAMAELAAALAIRPNYFHALFNLGNLHEDRGEADLARARYAQALAAEPGNAATIARLAMLDIHAGRASSAADTLNGWLAQGGWSPGDEADLRFAQARARDAMGQADPAFAALSRANALTRQLIRAQGAGYDRARQEALIDALIATFPLLPTSAMADAAPVGSSDPIFICGLFRSGSTLVEQVLAAHSRVTPGGELELLPRIVQQHLRPYPAALATMNGSQLAALRGVYLDQVARLLPGADRVTDKRPDNFLHIGLIKTLMPAARIVHSVRAVADNLLSLYLQNFDQSVAYSFDLEDIVHWIGQYQRLMAHWHALYPGDIHDLDYDALVADPEPVIRDLLRFCDLPFEPAVLAPHKADTVVRTASYLQVREPLHGRASGRAERYRKHLAPALSRLR